ncbi:hypothetical protein CO666_16935 [Rhizobium chutanense]|uniref:Uncharacterized protein n=1 Tax=Rhizobium chutanense TaxID=2035448 RepID=A0A2A6JBA1_9HYPH|nr:hypothetical protein [Rhizobium chutanense]PDT03252.1 hypothetical protein CO666_16935 [Rhizobium chutanense]
MSNIITFPIGDTLPAPEPDESDLALAQEKMKDVRNQIQNVFATLIAFHDELAKRMITSASLSEPANTNIPEAQGQL